MLTFHKQSKHQVDGVVNFVLIDGQQVETDHSWMTEKESISGFQERFQAAMRAAGAGTRAEFGRMLGEPGGQVLYNWYVRDQRIPASKRRELARLGLDIDWINDGIGSMSTMSSAVVSSPETGMHILSPSKFKRLPVVGTASLGFDGYWVDLEYPVGHGDGYFDFPTTDDDAYVLQVRGSSMHPAIRSGWYVVVEPSKSLQMGEFVLVKLRDGRSTVKEFLWHRDGEYVLNAVATGDRISVPEDDIDLIQHVGGILPPSGRIV